MGARKYPDVRSRFARVRIIVCRKRLLVLRNFCHDEGRVTQNCELCFMRLDQTLSQSLSTAQDVPVGQVVQRTKL